MQLTERGHDALRWPIYVDDEGQWHTHNTPLLEFLHFVLLMTAHPNGTAINACGTTVHCIGMSLRAYQTRWELAVAAGLIAGVAWDA